MSEDDLRHVLDVYWGSLGSAPPTDDRAMRTSELPVETAHGPLFAGVDASGYRHLLIPLQRRQRVTTGMAGAALRISERALADDAGYGRYADITCTRRDLDDVFTGLCRDVLVAVDADGRRPLRTTHAVVDRWRRLFSAEARTLSEERLVGVFGELRVLTRLLRHRPDALRFWSGPSGHCHDFTDGRRAVEVKSTASTSERRVFEAHGLDQLMPPEGGELHLAWHRFERSSRGATLGELVAAAGELCDDEAALRTVLRTMGVGNLDGDERDPRRLALVEERWYHVDEEFPRLVPASLQSAVVPDGVLDVRYSVDLAGVCSTPLEDAVVDGLLASMGGETS